MTLRFEIFQKLQAAFVAFGAPVAARDGLTALTPEVIDFFPIRAFCTFVFLTPAH